MHAQSNRGYPQHFAELKRRKVFRVIALYAAVAFAVIQVADPVATAYELPGWFLPAIVTLLLAGFPIAVVLAWALEVTPQGIISGTYSGRDLVQVRPLLYRGRP